MGTDELSGQPDKNAGGEGAAGGYLRWTSIPFLEVAIPLVTSCYAWKPELSADLVSH